MNKKYCQLIVIVLLAFYFIVPAASASASVNPDYGTVTELVPLEISEFTFGEVRNAYLENVRFTVTGGTGRYEYALSVAVQNVDGSLGESREIYQYEALLGDMVELRCNLQNQLDSYDAYVLILDVWKYYGNLEVNQSAVAEGTFSYSNLNASEAIEDFKVVLDVTDHTVYVDYAEWSLLSADSYLVSVEDGSPDTYYTHLNSDEHGAAVLFDENADALTIEVSYKDHRGRQSEILSKTIVIEDILTFEVEEVTINAQAKVSYSTTRDVTVKVFVSQGHVFGQESEEEENYSEIKLSGSGFFSVNLQEFDNLISVEYDAGDLVTIIKQAEVHRSIRNPVLHLPEHNGIISTSRDTFAIAGYTDPGMEVSVNDQLIETKEDGSFLYEAELYEGENIFEVMAFDSFGNAAAQNVIIYKTMPDKETSIDDGSGGGGSWFTEYAFLLGSFAVSVLFLLFLFIFRRRYDKMRRKSKAQAVINLCRNITAPFFILSAAYFGYTGLRYGISSKTVKSKAFAEKGLLDPEGMYEGIIKNQINQERFAAGFKIFGIVFVLFTCLLIASVLCRILRKVYQDHTEKGKQDAIETTEDAEQKPMQDAAEARTGQEPQDEAEAANVEQELP